ncbi:MAG: metallophosphoesterase [Spirochaetaceae bacterium]|nr:metallophosphoesterase [Spirochaetaceae bacterium]
MRIAIGDIHGRRFWKRYLDAEYTDYYLLGDYFDSPDIPYHVQYENFLEIVKAARNDARVKLCLGNHDYHYYLADDTERYSGYQRQHAAEIHALLAACADVLNVVYVCAGAVLVSHAGISNTFMKNGGFSCPEALNAAFRENPALFRFNGTDIYGDNVEQGPLWIRPDSLYADAYTGYSQVVGHTPTPNVYTREIPAQSCAVCTLTFIITPDRDCVYVC